MKSELSGTFEKVILLFFVEKCTSNFLCKTVANFFCLLVYGHPMEKDIKGDTSGVFKMLLVSLAQVKLFTEFSFNSVAIDNFSYMFMLTYRVKGMKIKLLISQRPKQMPNVCFKLVNFVFLII